MSSLMRTMLPRGLPAAMLACSLVATASGHSLQASQSKEPTGSISGRVMLGDKPAPRVTVLLAPSEYTPILPQLPRAATDDDGHFQLTNVPAGNYLLQTFTPAFVAPSDDMRGRSGKIINLAEGEAIGGVDIALTRGGVITGRVTDAEGLPVIQESVRLTAVNERGQKQQVNLPYSFMKTTDDRGVYRLFGLAPGRYIVSVGVDPKSGSGRPGFGNSYSLTYSPDVSDDSKATVIEVSADGEAAGVDILLGRASKTYSATGRIVDEAGKPVSGVNSGYGSLLPDGDGFGSYYQTSSASNSKGEFRIEGIVPGHYAAFASAIEQSDWYSDPVQFQVTDADVSGLEVKVHRGSTLSGVMSFEGVSDQEGVPKLSDLKLGVHPVSQTLTPPRSNQINIAPDGSFRAIGIQPGKVNLFIATYPPPKGLSVLRIELNGVDQSKGIEMGAGDQISGLSVVLGYGSGVIRGTLKVEGGTLPPGSRLMVQCVRNEANNERRYTQPVYPDIRGRFAFEGLLPGNYKLTAYTSIRQGAGTPSERPRFATQTVSVNNGAETAVTLVIDLNENKQQ